MTTRKTTRKAVMESDSVHQLTKDILVLSADKDVVDRYYDVKIALDVLKAEMDAALSPPQTEVGGARFQLAIVASTGADKVRELRAGVRRES